MRIKNVLDRIKKHRNFVITTHTSLEGDALGSELALYRLLKRLGKRARIINDDVIPYGYDILPGLEVVERYSETLKISPRDCFVTVDCSDPKRCGRVWRLRLPGMPTLNIDHHISNTRFGDTNWIEPAAASCTQMIYQLYKAAGVPVDKAAAMYMYAGLLTDTGSFRYPNTTAASHCIAADLLRRRIDVPRLYRSIYENVPLGDMRFLLTILPTMKTAAGGRVAWFLVRRAALKGQNLSIDLTEHLLNVARSVRETEVVALFKENLKSTREVRVNLRSRGAVNVNAVARLFGGGGHITASGCTIAGPIERVAKTVVRKIIEFLP